MSDVADITVRPRELDAGSRTVVARIRRLVVWSLSASLLHSVVTVASKAYCPGGLDADGRFIDANGDPTDTAPTCIDLVLGPSPVVYLAITVIVVWAISAVLRRGSTQHDAIRVLDRATAAAVVLALASTVIAQVWFMAIPITDWHETGRLLFPFPFGAVDVTLTPMNSGVE